MTRRGVLALLVVGLTTASCASDEPSSGQRHDDDATAAAVICAELRDQVNTLVDIANAAVADIAGLTPAERTANILAGYDDARAAADAFAADVATWTVPDIPERDQLIAEVGDGARAAIAELDDERAIFARDVPAVADDDVGGRVGQFFNGIEKALSVVEPAIAAYDRTELQRAFLDEPACRHVIQPFVVDG